MNRIRLAALVTAVAAVGFLVVGAGVSASASDSDSAAPKATWHAAPAPAVAVEGTSVVVPAAATPSAAPATTPGVLTSTESTNVALTFDDGPDPNYTPKVLELLRRHHAKATFCLVGVQVQQFPQLVRDIVADGHTLCNHTWKHDTKLGTRGEDAIRADIQRTQDAIAAASPGTPVTFFRHPGGMWTPRAVAVASSMGMASIGWDVDTSDWNVAKYGTGPSMRDHVLQVLRTQVKPGSVILSHDAGGNRTGTLAAYEVALPELLSRFTLTAL